MKNWIEYCKGAFGKRFLVGLAAAAMVISLAAYKFENPVRAAAVPAAAAPALDDNSVSALLSLDHAMEALAAHVTPAVVNVTVVSKKTGDMSNPFGGDGDGNGDDNGIQQFFFGPFGNGPFGRQFGQHMRPQPQIEHGLGSGVIISPDGYIVTNNHVIDGAMDIRVTMTDKRVLKAKLIGADRLTDLAVIKIDANNLPSVPLGDSTQLHPGQTVLAFGNPLGF